MAYGDLKCNNLIYETGSGDVTVAVNTVPSTAGATFTGDVTFDGATAGKDITFDRSENYLKFNDEAKAVFGTTSLTALFHNGTDLYVQNGAGDIRLEQTSGEPGLWLKRNGAIELYHDGSSNPKFETTTAGVTVTGTVSDSKGDVRDIPVNSGSSAMTLAASDAGKVVATTTGGWVVPTGLSAGNTFTLLNDSSGDQTINATALTTLYNTADGANVKASTLTLGARSMATIWMGSGTVGYIQATALTVS